MNEPSPRAPVERIVGRLYEDHKPCQWCEVQGRCSSGKKYMWAHGKGRIESPCMCLCHSDPYSKPPNAKFSGPHDAAEEAR